MDIRKFQYFIEIVRAEFNLSLAAKRLYISQSALTQFIKSFEESENTELFERYRGRLQKLTPAGNIFYEHAQKILLQYSSMLNEIRDGTGQLKGTIKIGIPPLILGVVFTDLIAQLIINHPEVKFEIIEKGAYELTKMFLVDEIDFAILLQPTNIDPTIIEEHLLQEDQLTAFMNISHPLAAKKHISWLDLNNQLLALLDESFIIQHKVQRKFTECNILPKKQIMSASWDFLMLIAKNSEFITILPSPVSNIYKDKNIVERHFDDPISWKVLLCRRKKEYYTKLEQFLLNSIIEHFKH